MVIFRPCRTACRTSSSQTKSAGFSVAADAAPCRPSVRAPDGGGGGGVAASGAGAGAAAPDGGVYPRDESHWSIRRASESAAGPAGAAIAVAFGSGGAARAAGAPSRRTTAGVFS
jgi:hypothetical protein